MSRPFAAQFVNGLRNDTGLDKTTNNPRKCLREVEIKKSEERVQKIEYILENQFINPFSTDLERDELYNLASGKPVRDDIADSLLTLEERGSTMMDDFCKRNSSDKDGKMLFFGPVTRAPWKGFVDTGRKAKLTRTNESKDIKVQRDILGLLAAKSQQQTASVNIDEALCYPLAPVLLSLATCDGARRKTAKSKLFHVALSSMEVDDVEYVHNGTKCYILDLAAIIRSIMRTPDTFRELANNILQDIPKQYDAIYIACDTYRSYSIKNAERSLRGDEDKFVIRSPDVRIPAD